MRHIAPCTPSSSFQTITTESRIAGMYAMNVSGTIQIEEADDGDAAYDD
jgi:hypothetical protein